MQGDAIAKALKDNPGYSLKLMGHSLGAGTAAVAAMLIKNSPEVSPSYIPSSHLTPSPSYLVFPNQTQAHRLVDNCLVEYAAATHLMLLR